MCFVLICASDKSNPYLLGVKCERRHVKALNSRKNTEDLKKKTHTPVLDKNSTFLVNCKTRVSKKENQDKRMSESLATVWRGLLKTL